MSRRRWVIALAFAAVAVATSRCSLLVGNFTECGDGLPPCASGRVCEQGYCVVNFVPEGCSGLPDASILATYGPDAGDAIRVGMIFNFTNGAGVVNASRVQQMNAVLLAAEEINTRGVGGHQFALQVCDTASNTALAKSQAAWMADRLGIKALIVPTSSAVVALADDTISRDVLLMSPTATAKEVTALNNPDGGVRLVWRTSPSDIIQAKAIADLLNGASVYDAGLSGVTNVGIAYLDDPYGQGLNEALGTQLAGKNLRRTFYTRGGDITASVATLDAFQPNLTVLIGFPDDVGRFVTAAAGTTHLSRASGHRWFFTDSAKDPAIISGSPAGQVEGSFGTTPAQTSGPEYVSLQSRFLGKYGIDPSNYAFIAHSYDAMYVVALGCAFAVGSGGTSPLTGSRIAEGIGHLESGAVVRLGPTEFLNARNAVQGGGSVNVEGASGSLAFDLATGEAPGLIELWQVDAGEIRRVTVIP